MNSREWEMGKAENADGWWSERRDFFTSFESHSWIHFARIFFFAIYASRRCFFMLLMRDSRILIRLCRGLKILDHLYVWWISSGSLSFFKNRHVALLRMRKKSRKSACAFRSSHSNAIFKLFCHFVHIFIRTLKWI